MCLANHIVSNVLVVYAAGRPPTANQMAKQRSISEIINPLLNEAQFVFIKNREFLQISGIFANLGNFCKSRDFFNVFFTGFFTGFLTCKSRDFLQKSGFFQCIFHGIFYVFFYVHFPLKRHTRT